MSHTLSLPHFEEKVIPVEGAQLYCRLFGEGEPIIFIHGAPMLSQDYFLPYLTAFEDHFLVFYDQRGCGKSVAELTDEYINMPLFVKDIETIRRKLGREKVTILGHSWGGFLGMKYAIEYPDCVEKLILLDAMPASLKELNAYTAEKARRRAHVDALKEIEASELYRSGDPKTTEKRLKMHFQTYLYDRNDIDKLNLGLTREAFLSGMKVLEILNGNFYSKTFDIYGDLERIKAPTLIVHGDVDPVFYSVAEHFHRCIPGSKLVKIEKCGHFPFVEQPQAMFSAINRFLV